MAATTITLEGTPKQVAWAESIRTAALTDKHAQINHQPRGTQMISICFEDTKTGARWDFADASVFSTREEADAALVEQGFEDDGGRVRVIYEELAGS